ncbi:MAG: xanthine dehydrogenase family protein molybdopterin-binding subunit [Dehalococcoidia bacterium]|nr:xanthine dehydrogenase family protein molybdopterin-binding subunit [Dehalococcoidia bacterium]
MTSVQAPAGHLKVVGTTPIRHDGADKVTGRACYGADIQLPGLLHGKVLRSPHAHARIRSVDPSRALALPGVKAVVTGAELPQPSGKVIDMGEGDLVNPRFLSNNCLAVDKALYKGHPVAAVAAVDPHVAEEALSLIDVDYEVLPPVMNVLEAMKGDAPLLHDRLLTMAETTRRAGGLRADDDPGEGSNVSNHFVFEIGDPDRGFREADLVVEREFDTSTVHQGYIEPHSATAMWHGDGSLTIWCSTQGHFNMRDQTAQVIGAPVSKIKVVPMEIGGGFGGKNTPYMESISALLARKAKLPVKLSMSRSEVFEATGPTSGSHIRVKMGATRDGRITAAEATLAYEAGAFPGSPVNPGTQCIFGPYDIPNARAEGYDVVVNKPKVAPYRAPGVPAAAFAAESVVDEICRALDMDPLEFRLRNAAREGSRRVTGPIYPRIGCVETLQAAQEHDHYREPLEGRNRGRGVACGFWFNGTGPSSAVASVNADGTVNLVEGSPDIGGTRTTSAMQLAEVLGIAAEDVNPSVGDTDSVGWTSNTVGSGVAFKTGWACYEAAWDIRRQLLQRAALIWDVSPDDVEYADGVISHRSDPALRLTFREIAGMLNSTGGPISGRGSVDPKGVGNAFSVNIVDVEVDPETGKVDILRYTAFQDVGKAVHPDYVEGQIQGGVAQGVGWALNEEYVFDGDGGMVNSSFLDYRMPTSLDLPMIDVVQVEVPNPGHPFGVRGVGEAPIIAPVAAVANAIHDALGIRVRRAPMSPATVLEALWQKGQAKD